MVKVGVTQWSPDGYGVETIYNATVLGFTAIQIDVGSFESDLLLDDTKLQKAYSQAAQDTGVKISAIAPGSLNDYGLTSPAGSVNANRCWNLIRIANEAAIQMNAVPN